MGHNSSVAASLNPEQRKQIFIEMQSSTQTITAIAKSKGVSRKFLYQQQQKGNEALELGFNKRKEESDILYWIPVTKNWIFQVILALIFICHSSYRGVVEFLRDLFQYCSVKPPCPQIWGSQICESPPELGDLGGGQNNSSY